ncbi:PocR ligand-binding domain-containing protein [Niameybacter massiliensis]|uniref:PocR ligand-binding domain-containing protein n=1 Tax=Holtiella tumoricola TaxID=3018743 RepID=A0AA42J378_9FIRM|nr:PocR ligand-binding domain-containing protein [Holtiella tumoricola]MDA3734060.1 PocR ligand-binding domain-containing protein [Holtiella tumoricola]
MKKSTLKVDQIIDFKKWDKLQDSMVLITKAAMIIIDYKGNPMTKHSGCQKFCSIVRADKKMAMYCQKCDSRGGLEAVRTNKPYIYLCHFGIVDIAVPIIVDDKYIGAIMVGQVKLSDHHMHNTLEQIVALPNKKWIEGTINHLKEHYEALPVLSYEEVVNLSEMIFNLSNYLVEEALDKSLALELNEAIGLKEHHISQDILLGYQTKSIENIKKEMSNRIISSYIEREQEKISVSKVLKPAIDYIYTHKNEHVSVKEMAELCHVSPSYFSRLFVKETGEKFSLYVSKLKIEWAKSILEETDIPISEMSEELGFNEPGYFIKIFKKYEGVTPHLYRKYYKK